HSWWARRRGRERGTRRGPRMMVPRMTSLEHAPSRSEALPRPLGFIASPATPGLAGRALSVALAARVPLLIALVTFVVFSPALRNHFVDWDDQVNFLTNNDYRGLGWTHIRWMFTSFLMGQWIPLTWMTLGLDYTLWGRSEEHTSELQSRVDLVCRLLLEKKK